MRQAGCSGKEQGQEEHILVKVIISPALARYCDDYSDNRSALPLAVQSVTYDTAISRVLRARSRSPSRAPSPRGRARAGS